MKEPRPMQLYENGMFYIDHEGRHNSFLWNADDEKGEFVGELEKIKTVRTLYTWGYYGFFKPTLQEVYDQIPDVDDCVGFTIELDTRYSRYGLTKDQKHHIGLVTLWRKKK